MKKLWFKNRFWSLYLVLSVCLFLLACQSDDDGSLRPDLIGIREVIAPESLMVGEKAVFILRYDRPTDCHGFLRFDTAQTDAQLRVGLVAGVFGTNCQPVDEPAREIPFELVPKQPGNFTVSFFSGQSTDGEEAFISFNFDVVME
ncbi:MAG: hypothetical protein KKC03_03715 [Bacteroidetes bacterium]|nr:hypothetical protein [Bacteroidota bacterium]